MRIFMLLVVLVGSVMGESSLPTVLHFKNGKTFEVAEYLKWAPDRVTVRYRTGAIAPVMLVHLRAEDAKALRDHMARPQEAPPVTTETAPPASEVMAITGQAFGKGYDRPYVFAGMVVRLYPRALLDGEFAQGRVVRSPPEPVAEARTDAAGQFRFEVAPGDYFVYATATRRYRNGNEAGYEWRVPVGQDVAAGLLLDESNRVFYKTVPFGMR